MNAKSASTSTTPNTAKLPRCLHRTVTGRRCMLSVPNARTLFCSRHSHHHANLPPIEDLAPVLLGDLTEIESASDTQRILSKLFVLLAQDRVSLKKASVLTYILQQLLRSISAVNQEQSFVTDKTPQIIFDMPRAIRDTAQTPQLVKGEKEDQKTH